ncbi:hypothetical protein LINGRAHAP2_LOCUS31487 [Linum grandiflorum]
MPLPRIVYRIGFLHYATKVSDKLSINMCRVRIDIFDSLCHLLKDEGGLQRTKNMDIDEMVAIFLVTVGHNIKNRTDQFLFQRSGETISRVFKLVLLAILKLSPLLLAHPSPVPADCTDKRWKHFQFVIKEFVMNHFLCAEEACPNSNCLIYEFIFYHAGMSRKYMRWTFQEDQVLFDILLELHECGELKNGTLQGCGYNQVQKRMQERLPNTKHDAESIKTKFRYYKNKFSAQLEIMNASGLGWDDEKGCCTCDNEVWTNWVKGHKHASGLQNARLARWNELCKIFEYSRADGTESMTPNDAASALEAEIRATDSAPYPQFDTYASDSNPIMEDLINEGFDMNAEGLRDVADAVDGPEETMSRETEKGKATSSGMKRTRAKATDEYLNALQTQMESMTGTLTTTSTQIVRLANNMCLPDDIATKRSRVIDEITRLPGISYGQRLKAHRIFMKEPSDLEAFFQLPDDQMKEDFILSILE